MAAKCHHDNLKPRLVTERCLQAPDKSQGAGLKNTGFMLIELAIAALVIGVAVLALLGIMHTGQKAAIESENETRAALFGNDVMVTLRLLNDRAASDPDNKTAWKEFWKDMNSGMVITQLTGFASEVWDKSGKTGCDIPSFRADGNIHTNYWCPTEKGSGFAVSGASGSVRAYDYAIQYRATLDASQEEVPLDEDGKESEPRYYTVTLHIWSGASRTAEADATFFSVFTNPGRLE